MIHAPVDQAKSINNVMVNDKTEGEVTIIGTGKVACAFLSFFQLIDFHVAGIWGRNFQQVSNLSNKYRTHAITDLEEIKSEWVLVCVSDDAIATIVKQLNHIKLVSITSCVFDITRFDNTSVFYPLQSFDDQFDIEMRDVSFILDGKKSDLEFLKGYCSKWEIDFHCMDLNDREKLHLVAVFYNNFTHHILHRGTQLSKKFNLENDLFKKLINNTFKRLDLNNMFKLQTGPAVREDYSTMAKHQSQLSGDFLKLYNTISESIIRNKHELQGETE